MKSHFSLKLGDDWWKNCRRLSDHKRKDCRLGLLILFYREAAYVIVETFGCRNEKAWRRRRTGKREGERKRDGVISICVLLGIFEEMVRTC